VYLAARGTHRVTSVEDYAVSASDLRVNAAPWADAIRVVQMPVERFVEAPDQRPASPFSVILDPPRSGMTREAAAGVVALGAARVVFVSCDVATFARDLRRFIDAGYRLDSLRGFDLFPSTAHVESIAVLTRA
jgi:tRNA/tmRNA/rRNA uracil-C5-methylase (TrmA/RlmC/RlmD family)